MSCILNTHHKPYTTAERGWNIVHGMSAYRLVESDNSRDTPLLEVVTIVVWGKGFEAVVDSSNIGGTREGQQLACMPTETRLTGVHAAVLAECLCEQSSAKLCWVKHFSLVSSRPDVSLSRSGLQRHIHDQDRLKCTKDIV